MAPPLDGTSQPFVDPQTNQTLPTVIDVGGADQGPPVLPPNVTPTQLEYGTTGVPIYAYDKNGNKYSVDSSYKDPNAAPEGSKAAPLVGLHPVAPNGAIAVKADEFQPEVPPSAANAAPSPAGPGLTSTKVPVSEFQPEPGSATPVTFANQQKLQPIVDQAIKDAGLTGEAAKVFPGLIGHESSWNPDATSPTGVKGLAQVTQATMKEMGYNDPSDPAQSAAAGAKYFKQMLDKFDGNVPMAMMAYNAGPNAPGKWDPSYVVKSYANAGVPLPEGFNALAGQLHQAQAGERGTGWGFGKNTANNFTLGALVPAQAALDSYRQGTSYDTQYDLERAQQNEWDNAHPLQSMASGIAGLAIPDVAMAKGAMMGAKALGEALPWAAKGLDALVGARGAYTPVTSGAAQIPRAIATGAISGAVDSGTTDKPIGDQVEAGAIGGLGGKLLSYPVGLVAKGAKNIYSAASGDVQKFYDQGQQKVARLLGTDQPDLTPSGVPGVRYSLPEMLGGENPQVSAELQKVTAGDNDIQQRTMENAQARVNYYHNAIGGPQDIANREAMKDVANQKVTQAIQQGQGHKGLDLGKVEAHVKAALGDKSLTAIEGLPQGLKAVADRMYVAAPKGPKVKPTGTLKDLMQSTIHKNGEDLIKLGKGDGKEHLSVYDPADPTLSHFHTDGIHNQVGYPPTAKHMLLDPNHALVVQHNHPRSTGMSGADIAQLAKPGVHTIIAHGHDGGWYAATKGPNYDKVNVLAATKSVVLQVDRHLQEQFRDGKISAKDFEDHFYHVVNKVLDSQGIINLTTSKQMPMGALHAAIKTVEAFTPAGASHAERLASISRLASATPHDQGLARLAQDAEASRTAKLGRTNVAGNTGAAAGGPISSAVGAHGDFETELEKQLQRATGADAPEKKLASDVATIHGLHRYVSDQLDRLDNPMNKGDKVLKRELTEIKRLLGDELNKVPGYEDAMNAVGEHSRAIAEMKFLQSQRAENIQGILSPATIASTIKKIEDARANIYAGVLGNRNRAKSVSDEALEKLRILKKDLEISMRAKVPVNVSSHAAEGYEGDNHISGLMHMATGTAGAATAGALGVHPSIGWSAAMVGQQAMKNVAKRNQGKSASAMRDILLNPTRYPPKVPATPTVPPGSISGLIGANAVNSILPPGGK